MSFAIRTGCIITFEKPCFSGSFRKPKFQGNAKIKVEIVKHSYGELKNQHTFTCKILDVIEKNDHFKKEVGDKLLIKGRNIYPNIIEHIQGEESKKDSYRFI